MGNDFSNAKRGDLLSLVFSGSLASESVYPAKVVRVLKTGLVVAEVSKDGAVIEGTEGKYSFFGRNAENPRLRLRAR